MTRLIYKVLSNTATTDEKAILRKWIKASVENRERYEALKSVWSSGNKVPEANEEEILEESFQKIKHKVQRHLRRKRQRQVVTIGAIATIIAALFIYVTMAGNSQNHLIFENEPVATVIEFIESKYHVRIDIENKDVMSCPFTGTFYEVELPSHLVASIANAVGAKYEVVTEGKYRLIGGDCR